MIALEPRWRTPGDFLADLPRFHCSVKPAHSFCTVCLRINTAVAADCPLRFEDAGGPPVRAAPPRAEGDFYPQAPPRAAEAEYQAMSHEHVSAAAVLPDAPVIEFASSTEPHKPRKRMKARVVQKRAATERPAEGDAAAMRRREPEDRVWATHEGAGPGAQGPADTDEAQLREWDPEAAPAPEGFKAPGPKMKPQPRPRPRPPKDP